MSLDRKDVRFRLDPDVHAAVTVLAEVAQVEIGEWLEMIVQREVVRRVHETTVLHERMARLGILGVGRELAGKGAP